MKFIISTYTKSSLWLISRRKQQNRQISCYSEMKYPYVNIDGQRHKNKWNQMPVLFSDSQRQKIFRSKLSSNIFLKVRNRKNYSRWFCWVHSIYSMSFKNLSKRKILISSKTNKHSFLFLWLLLDVHIIFGF